MAGVLESETSTMLAPAVDISEGVTLEALQILDEARSKGASTITEGDDSVFYSEDEETPQEVSILTPQSASVGPSEPAEPQSSPQILDAGVEEMVQSLSHDIGQMEKGSMHQSDALVEDVESLMENKVNHVSSFLPDQGVEGETETLPINSTINEELSKSSNVRDAVFTRDEDAPLEHTMAKNPKAMEAEQARETQERDKAEADGNPATTKGHEETDELVQGDESFNNPSQGKYGTVSFRRIRRGLARQRIEEFEAMMQL